MRRLTRHAGWSAGFTVPRLNRTGFCFVTNGEAVDVRS